MANQIEPDPFSLAGQATVQEDFGTGPEGWVEYWKSEIHAFEQEAATYMRQGERVVKRYRDDRKDEGGRNTRRYSLLWANVQTIRPAVFARPPSPVVKRRYADADPTARVASIILERTLNYQIETCGSFTANIRSALEDRLLPGIGTVWVRYQKGQSSPTGTIDQDTYAASLGELASVDYVYWQDFGFTPARIWEEVKAVWRMVYMTRKQLIERFGKEVGEAVPLDYTPARHQSSGTESDEPKHAVFKQATVYEIWDKERSVVTWISKQYPTPLDTKKDPIGFPEFFPCPKPMFATQTTGNLLPVADYMLYKDQAEQIDQLTQRLAMLTKALKVVGVYDSESTGVQRMLTEGVDNQLIPVDTWAAFAEKGGIKGVVDFFPVEVVATVAERLVSMRTLLIEDVYQITGLSDIVRGASNPNETLGAQKIKTQFASVRLEERKQQMARFAGDTLRLMGHIATTFFDPQTLVTQSAIMQSPDGVAAIKKAQEAAAQQQQQQPQMPGMPPAPPPQQMDIVQGALQLLKGGRMVDFRVEVTADSMIEVEQAEQQQKTTEFMTAVTQYFQGIAKLPPQTLPLTTTLLMWSVRQFRAGRDIEGQMASGIEKLLADAEAQAQQPPPPDPKIEMEKMKLQADQASQQQQGQLDAAKMQMEMQMEQQKMQMEMQKMQAEIQALREKNAAEIEAIMMKANIQAEAAQQKAVMDAQATAAEQQQSLSFKQTAHAQDMQHAEDSANIQHEQAEKEGEGGENGA
jgi:hypothetical protein